MRAPSIDIEPRKFGPADYTVPEMLAWLQSDTSMIHGTDIAAALISALEHSQRVRGVLRVHGRHLSECAIESWNRRDGMPNGYAPPPKPDCTCGLDDVLGKWVLCPNCNARGVQQVGPEPHHLETCLTCDGNCGWYEIPAPRCVCPDTWNVHEGGHSIGCPAAPKEELLG